MKYLIVNWTIRDGDNEYGANQLIKVDDDYQRDVYPYEDRTFFPAILENYYFTKATKYDDGLDVYELEGDYRLFELESIVEVSPHLAEELQHFGIMYYSDFRKSMQEEKDCDCPEGVVCGKCAKFPII